MKMRWIPWYLVLVLVILLPTCGRVSAQVGSDGDDTYQVSGKLLRRATARIDSLELRIMLLQNRAVEQDSLGAVRERWWQGEYAQAVEWGERWRDEARSFWKEVRLAIALGLGFFLASLD